MVSYRVRRLPADDEPTRRYHLYDRADQLLLVADQGSAWLPADQPPQVRFARPDGERVASMDLPRHDERRPDKKQNYAVIYEHAVYALITATETHNGSTGPLSPGPGPFTQLMIEVEGNRWPALRWPGEEGPLLTLYDADGGLSAPLDPDWPTCRSRLG